MTVNHPAALLRRLNPFCAHALEAAASLCQTRAHAEITIEHLLLKLLEQGEGDLTVISRRYEWDLDSAWQSLLAHLATLPRSVHTRPRLSDPLITLLTQAWLIASLEVDAPQIRSQHLLMALTEKPALLAANDLWILLSLGRMQLERLRPLLDAQSEENPGRQRQVSEPLMADLPDMAANESGLIETETVISTTIGTARFWNALRKMSHKRRVMVASTRCLVATRRSARWWIFSPAVARTIPSWLANPALAKPRWWKGWRCVLQKAMCRKA
jgi:ATP-dependent Clp protease ATP-binding subunit ClpA